MKWSNPRSLTTRTLLQVGAAVTLVIAASTVGTYFTILKAMERQGLEALSDYAMERARRENLMFRLTRQHMDVMKEHFLARWEQPDAQNPAEWFAERVEAAEDGAYRSKRERVRIGRDSTTWVRRGTEITPEILRLIMVSARLCEHFYPAWERDFMSLYVSSPMDFNTGVAPSEPEWVWDIDADFDQSASEWGGAGNFANNPRREPVWTGVVPNFTGPEGDNIAYVTLCTPVDVGGRHLVTFHQDVDLEDLIRNTAMSERPGVEHIIFRPDGRVIASPKVSRTLLARGSYNLRDSDDPSLRSVHAMALAGPSLPWSGYDRGSDSYIALGKLEETGWIFASVVPGQALRDQAFLSAQWVLWAGLGGLGIALLSLSWILRRQVAQPLRQLQEMIHRVSSGDTAARIAWTSNDELGRIAAACNQMARNIAERDARLQGLNQDLEKRVVERTEGLRQSEERFSRAFHGSHALLAILDARSGGYLDVNDSFLKTFGYRRDEVVGKRQTELSCWIDPRQSEALLADCAQLGFVRDVETPTLTRSGETRVILQSGDRVTIGDTPCILTVGSDITGRKQAEAEMRKALEREKELNQLKDNFVAMISHEFRTPLEMITTSTDILSRYFDRISAEQRARQLTTVQTAVKRMSGMMEEVLLLGRAEAGRLRFHPEDLHLSAWCRRLVEETAEAAGPDRELRLEQGDFPPMVMADESLLRHILTNLLSNALKYSEAPKPVTLRVFRRGPHAVFEVEDHGVGIPAADQPHLFDGFHRGGNVGQRPGTGLGLVIAKRCGDLHGGTLSFTSREGHGTVFTVFLPLFSETL